jgi:anti-sigma B factor antagonist
MEIKQSIKNEIAILSISGKMMGGPETQLVHEHIKTLMSNGIHHVVLDMAALDWLNSSGLGILIASFTTLKKENGGLVLANAGHKTKELLEMTRLDIVFQNYESVEAAMQTFKN